MHRFQHHSRTMMLALMEALELAMNWLSKTASAVAESSSILNKKIIWIAEVEINLMSMIFAAPKKVFGGCMRRVREQEKALATACGEFIAAKLVELGKLGNPALTVEYWQRMSYPANDIFESVKQALEKSTIGKDEAEAKDKDKDNATTSFESTVVEGLQLSLIHI